MEEVDSVGVRNQREPSYTEQEMKELRTWLGAVTSNSNRKNRELHRDYSDGVGVARIVYHYLPQLVGLQIHNYVPCHSTKQKKNNWNILQNKILSNLNLTFEPQLVEDVIKAKRGAAEQVLFALKQKIQSLTPTPVTRSQSASVLDGVTPPQSMFKKDEGSSSLLPSRSRSYAAVVASPAPTRQAPRLPSPSRSPSPDRWNSEIRPVKSALRLPGTKSRARKRVTFNLEPEGSSNDSGTLCRLT